MSKEKKVEAALEKIKECAKEEGISEEEVDGLVAAAKEAASNFDLSDLKNKLTNPEGAGSGLKESGPGKGKNCFFRLQRKNTSFCEENFSPKNYQKPHKSNAFFLSYVFNYVLLIFINLLFEKINFFP